MIDYRTCESDEFRCDSGQCIPSMYKCKKSVDERMGCIDNSHLKYCGKLIKKINKIIIIIIIIVGDIICFIRTVCAKH